MLDLWIYDWLLLFSHQVVHCSWDPRACSPPSCSVHRIFQARILEWIAISFSRGSSWPRDWTHVSCIGRQVLHHWASREARVTGTVWLFSVCLYVQLILTRRSSFYRWLTLSKIKELMQGYTVLASGWAKKISRPDSRDYTLVPRNLPWALNMPLQS